KTSDKFTVHQDGKGFDFQFKTYGATDQVDFKLPDKAKTLHFKLLIDGEKAETIRIIIGANGDHPEKSEFTLPAQPKKERTREHRQAGGSRPSTHSRVRPVCGSVPGMACRCSQLLRARRPEWEGR